ncbi:hypothetical protein L6Q79_01200 [bacterium]|nr:hypothetical protein [bacterium]NUN45525.1 hypothetical protein [bacterium]
MTKKIITLYLSILTLSSCAHQKRVLLHVQGLSNENYQTHSFQINGSSGVPIETGISVERGDFVFIEVLGAIHLGSDGGLTNGDGISGYSKQNKYNYKHGSVVTLVAGKDHGMTTISLFRHPIYYQLVDFAKLTDGNYLPCLYFFSDTSGNISFEINDVDYSNNSGDFTVNVYHLKKSGDLGRNSYNKCPMKEPENGKDCEGNTWVKEGIKGWFYHGLFNNSYRGTGKNSGCQCVYTNGDLVVSHPDQGTFDYGFWEYQGDIDDVQARHLHLIWDVLPHDLWIGKKTYNDPHIICK